jgi:hypothetical protein
LSKVPSISTAESDVNIRVCFIFAELYPEVSFGCFLKKPVDIKCLAERLLVEID